MASQYIKYLRVEQEFPVRVVSVNRLTGAVVLEVCGQITEPVRAGDTVTLHLTTTDET